MKPLGSDTAGYTHTHTHTHTWIIDPTHTHGSLILQPRRRNITKPSSHVATTHARGDETNEGHRPPLSVTSLCAACPARRALSHALCTHGPARASGRCHSGRPSLAGAPRPCAIHSLGLALSLDDRREVLVAVARLHRLLHGGVGRGGDGQLEAIGLPERDGQLDVLLGVLERELMLCNGRCVGRCGRWCDGWCDGWCGGWCGRLV